MAETRSTAGWQSLKYGGPRSFTAARRWHDLALPWGFGVGVAPAAAGYAAASRRPLKRLRMSIAALWTLVPGP